MNVFTGGAKAAGDLVGHKLCVVIAVSVADKYRLSGRVYGKALHLVHQRRQRSPASPGLADGNEMPLVVHVHHGLDGQHRAKQGGGGADAAAPLQVVQIVHREPVAHMVFFLLRIGPHLVDAFSGLLKPGAEPNEQPLPH
ncbi:hypothetical protein SDC9_144431 [bioreactor metagenome]|uniref:Uncharacterized protein n=1 Tax=bioreactor metagenome TaxID=1076179 RepID=A0A645E7Q5_9ZZZZ